MATTKGKPAPANRLMIGGLVFDAQTLGEPDQADAFQEAMALARQKFGHALCMCRLGHPLKLQVRLRESKFHLAVWPNEGAEHDSECIFFRDDLDESSAARAPAQVQAGVSSNASAANGPDAQPPQREALRIGLAAGAPSADRTPALTRAPSSGPASEGSKAVSIRSLANLLWERAALCKWHPTWQRDWGRVRYELYRTAKELSLNGIELDANLYVPRPYRENLQGQINGEWSAFVTKMQNAHAGGKSAPMLLIAPVRAFTVPETTQVPIMRLKHMRHPVGLTPGCLEFLQSNCRQQLRILQTSAKAHEQALQDKTAEAHPSPALQPEVVGFFLVDANSRGGVTAYAAWLSNVHPSSFIPAPNANAVLLVEALIKAKHSFQRLMTEAAPMQKTAPDWILRHVAGPDGKPAARVALDVIDPNSSMEYVETRHAMARKMAEKGIPTWTWVPLDAAQDRQVPPLPPAQDLSEFVRVAHAKAIQTRRDCDYTVGHSAKFSA